MSLMPRGKREDNVFDRRMLMFWKIPTLERGIMQFELNLATPCRIDWILSGDRSKASSRLQGFLIHEWLQSQGVTSNIQAIGFNSINSPYTWKFFEIAIRICNSKANVVVFEAPEWLMVTLSRLSSAWGKQVVAVRCDRIPGNYDDYFDVTILPTEGLRRELGITRGKIIEDAVEIPYNIYKKNYSTTEKPRVVWVGHASYESYIVDFMKSLQSMPEIRDNFSFELISSGKFATRQWSEKTVIDDILSCDIAILPIPSGEWFANKSSNRLAMMLSLGMPTIASPIPSYTEIGKFSNLLFAESTEEFARHLFQLRTEERRATLGRQARQGLGDRFVIDNIGPKWLQVFRTVTSANPSRTRLNLRLTGFGAFIRALAWCHGTAQKLSHRARDGGNN